MGFDLDSSGVAYYHALLKTGTDVVESRYVMFLEEHPVEYVLEAIDAEMEVSTQPRVILFDIGGVVVSSPFPSYCPGF